MHLVNGKAFILRVLAVLLLSLPAAAKDQFGGFKEYVTRDSLKPFTRDLGGLLGSACFHSGRPLGFNGLDIGVHGGFQFSPESGDDVLRRAGVDAFGVPWLQGEIGLPFRLDGFIRGVSFQGLTIAGGGMRWGLPVGSDKPYAPNMLLSVVGHSMVHKDFSASHAGANLVVSINAPLFVPYLGAGVDRTRVVVRASDLDASLVGQEAVATEPRVTLGFTVRNMLKFIKDLKYDLYLQAAGTYTHGRPGIDSGIGLRF